jgi:DNA-binding transcriptional regulator PaaX
VGWRLLSYRIATEVSRHRVAVWRELRRAGAVPLQSATWAVPTGQGFDEALDRAVELIERADGHAFVFDVTLSEATAAQLEELFGAEREAEWVEFLAECDKAAAELAHEVAIAKFTLAELDEEEQNHERLRRWFRDVRAKDLFGAPSAELAERRLKECAEALEDYAERVYQARQQS